MPASRALPALLATLAAAALAAAPADGAFPGRNGELAYHGKQSVRERLFVRDARGGGGRSLRTPAPPADPAYSPRGRRIAFSANGQLWVMNAEGTDARQVTAGPGPFRNPTWSPDGTRLAFEYGPSGRRGIYAVDVLGRGLRRLTDWSADEHSPAWSASDSIAFVRGGVIHTMAPGRRARRLARGDAPTWSPDGRRIAFTRGPASRADVYLMRADGSRVRRLTRLRRGVRAPAFSPDGRRIAFAAGRGGRRALHVMHDDGKGVRRIGGGRADPRSLDWRPAGSDPVIAAAADITCGPGHPRFRAGVGTRNACRQVRTSELLLQMELDAVLAAGDTVNARATFDEFMGAFDPSWGRLKGLIRPAPGNHEYQDPGAQGYFDYFNGVGAFDGPAGPRDRGYYSFDLGEWHIVSLNSQCSHAPELAPHCAVGSPQERWLRADLAASERRCVLAYWHHPPRSSGLRGTNTAVLPLVQALYDHGADVLLTGHDHSYERFAPTTPAGDRDGERGLRQFVVGTGGRNHKRVVEPKPHSEVRNDDTFGVLALELGSHGYHWQFVPEQGRTFTDSGANACH